MAMAFAKVSLGVPGSFRHLSFGDILRLRQLHGGRFRGALDHATWIGSCGDSWWSGIGYAEYKQLTDQEQQQMRKDLLSVWYHLSESVNLDL